MRTLTIATRKGGPGKSTLALNLAVAAAQGGARVLVVDLDDQRTAADWWESRDAEIPAVVYATYEQLDEVLAWSKGEGFDLVVLDTPGWAANITNKALGAADFALLPCQPTDPDIRAQKETVRAVDTLGCKAGFVLTRVGPRAAKGRVSGAEHGLRAHGLPIAPVMIRNREDYPDAYLAKLGVTEFDPDGKAAQEIRELFAWVMEKMERLAVEPAALRKVGT